MTAKGNFFRHIHPPLVRRRTLHPLTTLGLGIVALTCLAALFVTGITLFFYYTPEQGKAYERILHLSTGLHYGRLIRNIHYLSANGLLIISVLHLARVFFTASYKGRHLNWLYGLALFFFILLANFTGYLLPWDQISFWAVKIGISLAGYLPLAGKTVQLLLFGGRDIGPETLIRAFAVHVGILPPLFFCFIALHLWRIRKDGGLACPSGEKEGRLPAFPALFRLEVSVALITLSCLLLLALIMDAPIYERTNPLHPPNPARAPWFFVGIQEMVSYSALLGGVAAPLLIILFLAGVPLLDRSSSPAGNWFCRDRLPVQIVFVCMMISQIAFIIIGQWFRGRNWSFVWPF